MKQSLISSLNLIKSFVVTWSLTRITGIHPMNLITLLFFLFVLLFIHQVKREQVLSSKSDLRIKQGTASLFGALFTLFYLADIYSDLALDLENPLFKGVIFTVTAIGLFFLFRDVLLYLMFLYGRLQLHMPKSTHRLKPFLPLVCFCSCLLTRIPFLLYSWPGIMTPDSINQFEQVIGMQGFSNHHPFIHTMTIGLFYHIGSLFTSSVNAAFAFYTLFQICFMALAASYLIWVIGKYVSSMVLPIGIICLYSLMPYHNVMAICIWKDVLFAGTLLFFCSALIHLLKEQQNSLPVSSLLIYFFSGMLMCLYRSNGWYAFLLSFPFLLFGFRKKKKIFLPLHLLLLALVLLIKGPIMDHYKVEQPDFVESISIPLQQVSRVVALGCELMPEQKQLLEQVMDLTYVDELYTEFISDNMKELVRAGNPVYLEEHKLDYLKLWLALGIAYPGVYLDAYIQQTKGYYSPCVVYPVADVEGVIPNDTGLYGEYLISGKIVLKVREILLKLHTIIPLYGVLWSMGSCLWLALIFLALILPVNASCSLWIAWIPNLAIIATLMIATPVATEFRYAYHLVYTLPLYFSLLFVAKQTEALRTSD